MSTIVELDLRGVPPAQGSAGTSYIPAGRYPVRVTGVTNKPSSTNKPMYVIDFEVLSGEHSGARLRDQFVMPGPNDNNFPLQRLHGFLLELGFPITQSKFKIDLDKCIGKSVGVEVIDDELPRRATDPIDRPARKVSRVVAYIGTVKPAAATVAAPAATVADEATGEISDSEELVDVAESVDAMFA